MLALPMALTRAFVVAHSKFHDPKTTEDECNAIVCDTLEAFREHDPRISVWDVLPLFDREALRS